MLKSLAIMGLTATTLLTTPLNSVNMSNPTMYSYDIMYDNEVVDETTVDKQDSQTTDTTDAKEERGSKSGIAEDDALRFIEAPKATLDENTANIFNTFGGKILGFLLKALSVGLVLTVVCDLLYVAVPITQGLFQSLERSGIPIISTEAHTAAGTQRQKAQGEQGSGYGSGYGGGYGGGYGDDYGGGYGSGGNKKPTPGVKGYIKSSLVKMILVLAFAIFCLSGAYVHLGYVIGDAVSGAVKDI